MGEVLPDLSVNSRRTARFYEMSDADQIDEMLYRLETSTVMKDMAALAKDDEEALSLAPKLGPWAAEVLRELQNKSFEPTERNPLVTSVAFLGLLFIIAVG